MFSRIAGRYDVANRALSGGLDLWWRKRLVWAVAKAGPTEMLDLATGSGDVAFALARGLPPRVGILGMDFCQPMLDQAEIKRLQRELDIARQKRDVLKKAVAFFAKEK